jgi:hypothetical protein
MDSIFAPAVAGVWLLIAAPLGAQPKKGYAA